MASLKKINWAMLKQSKRCVILQRKIDYLKLNQIVIQSSKRFLFIGGNAKRDFSQSHEQKQKDNHEDNWNNRTNWTVMSFLCGLAAGFFSVSDNLFPKKANAAILDENSPFLGHGDMGMKNAGSVRKQFNFVADVVKKVGPAVVYIERMMNIPFRRSPVAVSNGSGFIVESDGLIITNAHVVGNQSTLKVRLQDGREFNARVIHVDEARDIAAIKINCRNLPRITLGTTQDLRVGEWVVAIGSPLALRNTVTAGIVSNMCRAGKELGLHDENKRDMEYIQTDATINVGNSGGPLVNLDGQVIGVNTMMASAGIAFAIPVDYVKDFLERIKSGRLQVRNSRRWIGIRMLSLTPDIAAQLRAYQPNFPDVNVGVFVHRVQTDSPAALAGLMDGDVIIGINGEAVVSAQDVYNALRRSAVIVATVRRKSETLALRIVAEEVLR